MTYSIDEVRVGLAPDGVYPPSFRWAGRDVRVLSVEGLRTCGPERRFRVRTVEGVYELAEDTRARRWRMMRSPTWFARTLAQLGQEPRYSLPAAERRVARRLRQRGRGRITPREG